MACAPAEFPTLNLVVVHSHFRPGGVRRVIELSVPALVARWRSGVARLVLLGGEAPEAAWLAALRRRVPGARVECAIDAAAGYISEQHRRPATIARRLHRHLESTLSKLPASDTAVWAHNQGLGRNLLLTRALVRECGRRGIPLVLHHHDWWLDNRWARWPEMRRCGFRTMDSVARTLFPAEPLVRHAAINRVEAAILKRHFGTRAAWLPNPAGQWPQVSAARRDAAAAWLRAQLGDSAPVWLAPCRLLRRKNLAEALLLTRWLRPDAWLVTTGGISSPAESPYANALGTAARQEGWRLRLSVLDGVRSGPSIPELLAASEAVLLTSLQEGFGLPYVEAAAAGRPLIARSLPNVAPDLQTFGFHFPQLYQEVWVDTALLDWVSERERQLRLFRSWRDGLPAAVRPLIRLPGYLTQRRTPAAVPFSRMTLTAQLEVLRHPADHSWALCVPHNPFLVAWRPRAATGRLQTTPWPAEADRWLGDTAYVRRLQGLLRNPGPATTPGNSSRCQRELLRTKLQASHLYPLLWQPAS